MYSLSSVYYKPVKTNLYHFPMKVMLEKKGLQNIVLPQYGNLISAEQMKKVLYIFRTKTYYQEHKHTASGKLHLYV